MPQSTSATFSRVERAGPGERHARLNRPPSSIGRRTGRISTNAAEPIRTRRIKQEWPDLKVLVVTSQYGDDSRVAALAAGADGFLDKWDITTDLVPTILRLARGSHRL